MSSTPPASSSPSRPPRPAPVVPDYELERLIGRGSYGEVWLAHTALGARRAVKVVYRDSFDSERPYLREFAGIRAYEPVSSHESQVSVFHVGKNDEAGHFYYVMELADDAASLAKPPSTSVAPTPAEKPADYVPATLGVLLKQRGRLPCTEALPVARALASALEHLHGHGLVHRDIKPANIIFVGGRPKLADIGLVTNTAGADTLVGTTGYIPPEGPGTSAADLYSFGKVLYEMVTGNDRQDFPNLPDDFAQLPDREQLLELNEIILRCCHMDPRERYATAAEVLADVRRIEAGRSLRRDRARRRQLAVAVVLLTLGLGGGAFWWQARRAANDSDDVPARDTLTSPVTRWTNSLGMAFISIPGLRVDFCVWETRVRDFQAFEAETGHQTDVAQFSIARGRRVAYRSRTWSEAATNSGPDHPVRAISWEDANAFCDWLTQKEQAAGVLRPGEHYRLPRDAEWSWAAGLTNEVGRNPFERERSVAGTNRFYWGSDWPPPAGAGNFSGGESIMTMHVENYRDPFPRTAPVGSFPPEAHGLFDMAGNVSEFCADELKDDDGTVQHVARGANWESHAPATLQIASRIYFDAHEATVHTGFRVVRATVK